ncbi:MAG: response regulator transcription factor [Bacteroidetes bacterium]|nr:MAG: response regulator transcription factor [Bacteroidota bacterium]
MIKVGIAEDQEIFRKGLRMLLDSFENISVIHEAENGQILLDMIESDTPDVVILDYSMPVLGGIPTAKRIRDVYPTTKIIILSMYDEEEFIENAIENGVNCYLSKDDDLNELESAIKGVMTNHYYLNDRLSKLFINGLMKKGKMDPRFNAGTVEFSEDEMKVLELISQEKTTQDIADIVNKSTRTVEKYRTRMMEKVGAHNSVGLIMYAVKHKILSLD